MSSASPANRDAIGRRRYGRASEPGTPARHQSLQKTKKLVSFADIDPMVMQYGIFTGSHNRLTKRGSPYFRSNIWMQDVTASRVDTVFKEFYEKKRSKGKSHGPSIGAVTRKFTKTTPAVLMISKPYEIRLNPDL